MGRDRSASVSAVGRRENLRAVEADASVPLVEDLSMELNLYGFQCCDFSVRHSFCVHVPVGSAANQII